MLKTPLKFVKGTIVVALAALCPVIALGQSASADWIQEDYPGNSDYQTGPDSQVLLGTVSNPIAEASAIESTHSISAYSTGSSTQGYRTDAELTDTFTATTSGLVQWSIDMPDNFGGSDFWESFLTFTMEIGTVNTQDAQDFSAGDFTYLTEESAYNYPGFLNGSVTGKTYHFGDPTTANLNSWVTDVTLSFHAQAGIEYEFSSTLQAIAYAVNGTSYSGDDPHWIISTPAGMTYTTGSGYQIQSVPEPAPVLAIGLGCAGLFLRRRK